MAAAVVYEGVPNTQGETGTLFQGQKFWFSATVPQRKWFVENVEANGGEVVPLEKQADVLLVDHARKNPPPGTYSYQYVELSIRKGRLENLNDHVIGGTARTDRPVGSVIMAPKSGRNPYTEADDQFLWNWVKPLEEAGGATGGNSIYQHLEAANPRHTYQSWRDRWLKYVRHQKREVTTQVHQEDHLQLTPKRQRVQPGAGDGVEVSPLRSRTSVAHQASAQVENRPRQSSVEVVVTRPSASPDPSSPLPALNSRGKAHSKRNAEYENSGKPIFTDDEYDELFEAAQYILITDTDSKSHAWLMLARSQAKGAKEKAENAREEGKKAKEIRLHLAEEWRAYFETVVGPDYDEQVEEETGRTREDYLADGETAPEGATTEVRQAEGSNHAASAESLTQNMGRGPSHPFQPESPIFSTSQPESPTAPFSTPQERVPGSNEARKRSAGKGTNSQESTNGEAHGSGGVEELSQRSTQSEKRKRDVGTDDEDEDSPSLPPFGNQEQVKRRKKFKDELRTLEIPSTPEPERARGKDGPDEEQDLTQEAGSPTPRSRNYPQRRNRDDAPSSPLFVPQTHRTSIRRWSHDPDEDRPSPPIDAEEDEQLPTTPRQRKQADPNPQTSPLSVHLVSDLDRLAGSSFSHPRIGEDEDNGSPTPEFETAPEFSQIWEPAQEEAEAARPDTRRSRDGTIAETQPQDWFALPEPESALVDLPVSSEADDEEGIVAEDESEDEEDAASEAESMETWLEEHLQADPDADSELLIKAAGIADLHFKLADLVYQRLTQGRPVPKNMKGIWTERDDQALMGNDVKEIRRIEEKHGTESLVGRWHYLKQEQG